MNIMQQAMKNLDREDNLATGALASIAVADLELGSRVKNIVGQEMTVTYIKKTAKMAQVTFRYLTGGYEGGRMLLTARYEVAE